MATHYVARELLALGHDVSPAVHRRFHGRRAVAERRLRDKGVLVAHDDVGILVCVE